MPIINPIWFYIIDVLPKISICLGIIAFVLPIAFFTYYFITLGGMYKDNEIASFKEKHKSNIKKVIITTIVCVVGFIAIPSEKTMYQMLVAKNVTYENVDKAQQTIKDGVDYIFEKLNKEDK